MSRGYRPDRCGLCGSAEAEELIRKPRSLTSDSRIVELELVKLACRRCGLVRSGSAITERDLVRHYAHDYVLGVDAERAEPLLPDGDELVPRSLVFERWIAEALAEVGVAAPDSILEVGCGEGRLLERLAGHWRCKTVGVEPGRRAEAAARGRGLEVITGGYDVAAGRHDLVYAVAVLEHVPSPRDFLGALAAATTERGIVLVAQPTQDTPSSDIFFVDHLWHFCSPHVAAFASAAGLEPLGPPLVCPVVPTFTLHVFRRGTGYAEVAEAVEGSAQESISQWSEIFTAIDIWLERRPERRLAVWGLGQTFQLLRTYSALGAAAVALGIEDNLDRFQPGSFPFPVVSFEAYATRREDDDLLLTFVPGPHVVRRLRAAGLRWFAPLGEAASLPSQPGR